MLDALRACLDRRVLVGLALLGVAVWIVAPQFAVAALPVLVAIACPASMAVMAVSMRDQASAKPAATRGRPDEITAELEILASRQERLQAELRSLDRSPLGSEAGKPA